MNNKWVSIHPGAQLGAEVTLGQFVTIEEDVVIGQGSWIGSHVTILSGSRIGRGCHIFPGAIIGAVTQGKAKPRKETNLHIGEHTVVREFATLNKGCLGDTMIGSHVLLMAYVHIGHDCFIEDHAVVANGTQIAGHAVVGEHAVIGGMAAIHQHMQVGAYSMVASKSIVRKDIPPFIRVGREPLQYCGLNRVAMHRHGFTDVQRNHIEAIYRLIYQSRLPLRLALERIKTTIPNSLEKEKILAFLSNSQRGIVKKNSCQ